MTPTEKSILKLLKDNVSQSAIAKQLGVPRSTVQRVSDNVLGVDPASLKSLTNDQITQIHKLSADGLSKQAIGDRFNVSAKIVARALMVKITEHANQVTVISLNENLADDGAFDESYEVAPGGLAKVVGRRLPISKDDIVYVAAWLEDLGRYLVFGNKNSVKQQYKAALVSKDDLEPVVSDSGGHSSNVGCFNVSTCDALSHMANSLTETGLGEIPGYEFLVQYEGSDYPLRGKLNAKSQVGFFDALINRTVRAAFSSLESIQYKVKDVVEGEQNVVTTKETLDNKDLDVFLSKHQILILPQQIVIVKDGNPLTIDTSHPSYDAIAKAIQAQDIDAAYALMEPRKAIEKFSDGHVKLEGRKVFWDGNDITKHSIASRLLKLAIAGDAEKVERMAKFMDKVYQNPSAALVQSGRIFEFMAYSDIEIDSDGDIMVYKSVRGNYMDKHSGTISNKPGTLVRMNRSFVNDNNSSLCSYGLHVCSLAYLRQCFGNLGQRVVRCKLNPKDIVSITNDYGSSKIRCCEYLVLDDYTTEYNRQYKSIDMEGFYK
uniref:DNA-binding protein n=1 Tax=Serratia phage Kevin TaxID=3161161 RepID=A0AAU8L055_9CAUD